MPSFRLNRRAVLKGAGGVAIALPFLEIMKRDKQPARAAVPARRFIAVYQPGGTVLDRWRPTGTGETSFTLSPILSPLEPMKSHVVVLDGLDMKSAVGEQRQSGIIAWLTGTPQITAGSYAKGPSIDQVIATLLPAPRRIPSLGQAVRWATGRSHGLVSPFDIVSYENRPRYAPIPPRIDPQQIWRDLFGGSAADVAWDKSILDAVGRRYVRLAARLGAEDRRRLDEHLTKIRDLEAGLANGSGGACVGPALVDTSDYNPASGLNSADNGSIKDLPTDAAIPKVGKLMMDMLVMAMACDLTAVGTLQWADTPAEYTPPWLGLTETHYYYQNDGGYHPDQCAQIATWYSSQHAYLLQQMAAVDMGGHSLLDESVLFFGSEVQGPADHSKANMPFLLAGHGGGLRPGRWLQYNHRSHNDLLVAILQLFGSTATTFGDTQYNTGALTNLT